MILFLSSATLVGCAAMSGRETLGEYIDDSTITANVKAALIDTPYLKAHQIHVETFQGVVQLSGFVDSRFHATDAEMIAKSVKGVKKVRNSLVVR